MVAGCARAALILKSSQCPYGRLLTCCSLFAGRWCLCFEWHSDHLIVHHQWEFSSQCAHSRSKVPIAPLGIPANLPKSTLIFQFGSIFGPTREMYVPAMPANFPSPPWETTFCSMFAGRWCLCLFWHSDHIIVHHQWEHSIICAFPCSKFSHRPDGKIADALALILASATAADASVNYSKYVPQRPQNFPLPRWERC